MSNNVAWLLLSFAIMVVAALVTLYEKLEDLEKRLHRLEGGSESDDDGISEHTGSVAPEVFRRRDPRI